jgi:hypothetical protein
MHDYDEDSDHTEDDNGNTSLQISMHALNGIKPMKLLSQYMSLWEMLIYCPSG